MTKQELNFAVTQAIIYNQLCLEANDKIKTIKPLYRQKLKYLVNELEKEFEKYNPIYDDVYDQVEPFLLHTQQQLEMLIPMLRELSLGEITTLPHLIEAYKTEKEKTEKFLCEILNKELV